MDGWIGIGGVLTAAVLAFVFGRVNLNRATEHERIESLRRERMDALGGFFAAAVQYRHAQVQRWRASQARSAAGRAAEPAGAVTAVRESRADAWAAYYRVMLAEQNVICDQARHILRLTRSIEEAKSDTDMTQRSDDVYAAIDELAKACRSIVGAGEANSRRATSEHGAAEQTTSSSRCPGKRVRHDRMFVATNVTGSADGLNGGY